jgi:hypothetical protein
VTYQSDLNVRALEYGDSDTYTGREMGRRKTSGPPRGKRANRPNMVAAAIALAGGPMAVAELCGVRRQSVYVWIKEWKVERLVDALKLAQASGIPIERLAGEATEAVKSKKVNPGRKQAKPEPG